MGATLLVIVFGYFSAVPAFSETMVGGAIVENTRWTIADSPYLVVQNVRVNEGVTLTIEPGVVVKNEKNSDGYYGSKFRIEIEGTLVAKGSEEKRIVFTSNSPEPEPGDWEGILFSESASAISYEVLSSDSTQSSLEELPGVGPTIEYVSGNEFKAVQSPTEKYYNSGPFLTGSVFQYVTIEYADTAIYAKEARPNIDHVIIRNNNTGFYGDSTSSNITKVVERIKVKQSTFVAWLERGTTVLVLRKRARLLLYIGRTLCI